MVLNYDNCYEEKKEVVMIVYDREEGVLFRLGGIRKSCLRNW